MVSASEPEATSCGATVGSRASSGATMSINTATLQECDQQHRQFSETGVPICNTLTDLSSFGHDALSVLTRLRSQSILTTLKNTFDSDDAGFSTSFSGVDAPGSAIKVLEDTLADTLNTHVKPLSHVAAVEVKKECQQELLHHPNAPVCLFCDIEEPDLVHFGVRRDILIFGCFMGNFEV